MKLTKLSLAAIVALGALTTTASAQDLSEAIKGVDVSGYVRYRFDDQDGDSLNKYKVGAALSSPMAEDVKATVGFVIGEASISDNDASTSVAVNLNRANFTYTGLPSTTLIAGLQALGTPIDDDAFGTGLVALYGAGNGLTLAAAHFDDIDVASGAGDLDGTGSELADGLYKHATAIAAIYGSDMIKAQAWYIIGDADESVAAIAEKNEAKWLFAELAGSFSGINAKAQYAGIDREWSDDDGYTTRIELGTAFNNINVAAGYITNDKDYSDVTLDDSDADETGALLNPGWKMGYDSADTDYTYLKAGTKLGKLGLAAAYISADLADGAADTAQETETYGEVSYALSSKLATKVRYSSVDPKSGDNSDSFRLEAKYSF